MEFLSPRSLVLVSSVIVALGSGTNYVYSAYAPQLGSQLHITHTQLNIIGLAANMGVHTASPILGRLVDLKGPRPLFIIGFCLLFVGYSGIRYYFDAATPLSTLQLCTLVMFSFFVGVGCNAGLTAALNATAKSFSDRMRATTTSLVAAGVGLSAFFFSSIARALFPGDASKLLLLLAFGTSLPLILGLFTIRVIPPTEPTVSEPHAPRQSLEAGLLEGEGERPRSESWDGHMTVATAGVYAHLSDSELEEDESRAGSGAITPVDEGRQIEQHRLELSPSQTRNLQLPPQHSYQTTASRSRSGSQSRSRFRESYHQHEHVDIHGWALLRSSDFWILVGILSCLSGTGLMYINNVGSISQALFAHDNPDFDAVLSAQWQATQVSLISIANCVGRIALGSAADFGKHHWGWHRSYWMSVISMTFILSQIFVFAVEDVTSLWKASLALGFAYGGMYGLFPTIVIESFGLDHFSQNWGVLLLSPILAGNVFSLAFGRNLDAHAPAPTEVHGELDPRGGLPSADSGHQCLEGRLCYADSAKLTIVACIAALSLSVLAAHRVRRKKARRHRPGREETEVLWEGGNE